jgi:hypothetical protein
MESTSGNGTERLKLIVAVLIALTTMIGALVGWRATVAGNAAGGADADGLAAAMNVEETGTTDSVRLSQHYQAYVDFVRYRELGHAADVAAFDVEQQLLSSSPGTNPELEAQLRPLAQELRGRRDQNFDMASVGQYFFITRYLTQEGGYNTRLEEGEAAAESAQRKDTNPGPHFAQADRLRARSNLLVGVLIVLALAVLLYTLTETTERRARYAFLLAGAVFMLAGSAAAIGIELIS